MKNRFNPNSLDQRTVRTNRRAFQNWAFLNHQDTITPAGLSVALKGFQKAHKLTDSATEALGVAHRQFPRVVTASFMD